MKARGFVATAVVALLLAGCTAPVPEPSPRTAATLVLPDRYADPGLPAPRVPDCENDEGRKLHDPQRTLNPVGLERDAQGVPTGTTLKTIRDRRRLVVGISQTTPLLSSRDLVTGKMEGYEIDIVNRIAARLFDTGTKPNDPLQLVTVPTENRLLALNTEKNRATRKTVPNAADVPVVDIVLANVTLRCDRVVNHDIVYSTPYLKTNAGVLTRSDGPTPTKLEDIKGKVCAGTSTTSIADLLAQQGKTGGLTPVSVPDSSDCLMLLQRGAVDAVYTDYPILLGQHLQDPGTTLADLPNQGGGVAGIVMSKDAPDLIRFVNGVLSEMRADGSLKQSRDHWFVDKVREAGVPDPVLPLDLPAVIYAD